MFEEEFEQQQVSIQDYIRILFRSRWIIIVSFIVVLLGTLYYTYTTDPVYEATTTVLIQGDGMEQGIFEPIYFGNQRTLLTNQIEILKSRTLAERVVKRLDLSDIRDSLAIFKPNEEGTVLSLRAMAGWLGGNMEVEQRKDTDIIEIRFRAGTSFEAAFIVNEIADEFKLLNAETNRAEITDLRFFIEKQLDKKKEELANAEEELRAFQEREKVASLDGETTQLVERLAQAESMMEQAQVELNANQENKQTLLSQLEDRKTSLASDLSEISTPYLTALQNQLAEAEAEKTKFIILIESDISNPNKISYQDQVKSFENKIKAIREKLKSESEKIKASSMIKDPFAMSQDLISRLLNVESENKALTAKITALKSIVIDYEQRLETLPDKILNLARLERKKKVQEETYLYMIQKYEETKIQEAGQSKNVRILDKAIEPLNPVVPKKKMNMMLGALIGLGLGIGIAFLREYFDNSIRSAEELEKMGYNLLAAIPRIEKEELERKMQRKWVKLGMSEGQNIEARLITHFDPKSPISEAYRTLRTNLQFSKIEGEIKTVLITSSGPKEGKSTTIANLAITLAQFGSRVLLIDTDLRRPVIHSIFGLEKEDGLTNYMMGQLPYEKLFKESFIENLKLVTSGVLPPNPSELLGSKKMEELIGKLKNDFDIILFDSPPVIAVTDPAILSTKVDCTLLVVASNQTNREAVQRADNLLQNVKARVIGLLLNNVDVESTYGSKYYYYYHYYYYGAQNAKGRRKKHKRKKAY